LRSGHALAVQLESDGAGRLAGEISKPPPIFSTIWPGRWTAPLRPKRSLDVEVPALASAAKRDGGAGPCSILSIYRDAPRPLRLFIAMSYSLSVLDKSPVAEGAMPAEALRHTIALAKRADELGYHRFWLAEHHGAKLLASSVPEIVAAHILAHTSRIRVGSGRDAPALQSL
jgi:hypothetical protein